MSTVPDFMPVLSAGSHRNPQSGACIMEYASFLSGEAWTDHPKCTHPVIAEMARNVNDQLSDGGRQELLPLLPRLMGTASDDRVLSVRLAVWCAQQVAYLNPDGRVGMAIEAAAAWCERRCWGTAARANAARANARDAANVTYTTSSFGYNAAYNAAHAAAHAAQAAWAAQLADAAASTAYSASAAYSASTAVVKGGMDLAPLLTGIVDEYDRLTGRTAAPEVTAEDLARCVALTKGSRLPLSTR